MIIECCERKGEVTIGGCPSHLGIHQDERVREASLEDEGNG